MYTKNDLIKDFKEIGIDPEGTLLVHSSMKSVGEVEGRADTVIDAFMDYMKDGLLVFPAHSWSEENNEDNIFNPKTEKSCVGILTNIFRKREGVLRSLHPTHSLAAYGKDAEEFISGEEKVDTPCPRNGCYGKLYDRNAQILFLGCTLKSNTFIHGVEEWNQIPNRLGEKPVEYKIITGDKIIKAPVHPHQAPVKDVSKNYDKLREPLLEKNICRTGKIGDAESYLCQAKEMADLTSTFLQKNQDLFLEDQPVPEQWYKD
ncbi:AAC(3) family N-acetyltransferase [Halanaerobium sp.]|uniref:AAC(3) family N-acetyltransferase n=1 Tax=Halanaerobium sp. TaxID=1895664 RepID=UPI000DE6F588|nr:AAC(3) family N-acetyltransferase [Halanaerobium sp.]PUU93679.1 MAG: Aminoglycoside N3-acetyltransferase [Halanaerobium sp.]